jgi:hypothetical protein
LALFRTTSSRPVTLRYALRSLGRHGRSSFWELHVRGVAHEGAPAAMRPVAGRAVRNVALRLNIARALSTTTSRAPAISATSLTTRRPAPDKYGKPVLSVAERRDPSLRCCHQRGSDRGQAPSGASGDAFRVSARPTSRGHATAELRSIRRRRLGRLSLDHLGETAGKTVEERSRCSRRRLRARPDAMRDRRQSSARSTRRGVSIASFMTNHPAPR